MQDNSPVFILEITAEDDSERAIARKLYKRLLLENDANAPQSLTIGVGKNRGYLQGLIASS